MAKTKRRRSQAASQKNNTLPLLVTAAVIILVIGGLVIYNQSTSKPVVANVTVDYPTGVTADGQPFKGGAEAKVTIEDFSDFRCPHCATFAENLAAISDDYIKTGKVKVIFRNFAFLGPGSTSAAQASECALEQSSDAFWAYHDAVFANQSRGESIFTRAGLKDIADQIGLDANAFSRCINTNQTATAVQQDKAEGDARGVTSTPTLFINGQIVRGALNPGELKSAIEDVLAQ